MQRKKSHYAPLDALVDQINEIRGKETIEKFCYGLGLNKVTLSKILNRRQRDCRMSTIAELAQKLNMRLVIKLEKK